MRSAWPRTPAARRRPRGRPRAARGRGPTRSAGRSSRRARGCPDRMPSARPRPSRARSRRPRTAAAPAAARRRPPRSRRPRRRAGRARRRRPAATRTRARRPRCGRRAAATTCAIRRPASPNGSNTNTGPSARRRSTVHASRSVLIEEAIAGPSHSSSAGTARPADLPDCGGPKATSAWRSSACSSRPRWRPSVRRPVRGRAAQRTQLRAAGPAGAVPSADSLGREAQSRRDRDHGPAAGHEEPQRGVELGCRREP